MSAIPRSGASSSAPRTWGTDSVDATQPAAPTAEACPSDAAAESDRFVVASSGSAPADAPVHPRLRSQAAQSESEARDWVDDKWNSVVASGVRAAQRLDVPALASDEIMKQIDKLAAGDPGYTPAARNLLQDELRRSAELQLADSLVADTASQIGDGLRFPVGSGDGGDEAPTPAPALPDDGFRLKPSFAPTARLSLDPDKRFLDQVGFKGGMEASTPELRLNAELTGTLNSPLAGADEATVGTRFGMTSGPLSGSVGGTATLNAPFSGTADLSRVDVDARLNYGQTGVFANDDRLNLGARAYAAHLYGPDGGTTVGAEASATYMARGVFHPKDALSVAAYANYRDQNFGPSQAPEYGAGVSVAYHF